MVGLLLAMSIGASALVASESIRAVDFENFSFPGTWDCGELGEQTCDTLKLVDGKSATPSAHFDAYLGFVRYGDVTGDGYEEAVVRLGWWSGGTGQFSQLLVFTPSPDGVGLIHRFPIGDRAYGSYLDACVQDRHLVVVREYTETCMVCLEAFETTEYGWTPQGFELVARDLLQNPARAVTCDLCEYTTVCGNRPFEFMACC